ncbi:S1C family serine protease [Thermodesulfobacteriota bacterium]
MPEDDKSKLQNKYQDTSDKVLLKSLTSIKSDDEDYDMLVEEAKRREIVKVKDPGLLEQHPAVINAVIFILLSKDIVSFISVMLGIVSLPRILVAIFWDLFCSYYLLKKKNWARLLTIGRAILGIILMTSLYLPNANYIGWVVDVSILSCVLILLFGIGNRKKALIVSLFYSILIIIIAGMNIRYKHEETRINNIIKSSTIAKEKKSEEGYKIILPSNHWRFLDREKGLELIGDFGSDADIFLTDLSGKVNAVFFGDNLDDFGEEVNLNLVAQKIKKDYMEGNTIIREVIRDKNIFIKSSYVDRGIKYVLTYAYRVFSGTAINCYFFGEFEKYNDLEMEIRDIIDDMVEISKKQFLKEIPPKEIYKKYNNAVVLIRVYGKKGELIGFASGFNIHKKGLIVTNLHAIELGYFLDIKFPYLGIYEDVYINGLSEYSRDLATLYIEGENLPVINVDKNYESEVGDKVIVISNPKGLVNTLSQGIISGIREFEGNRYYQVTAPISQGSSGGPAFDQYSNIIGICAGRFDKGQNLNFIIPIEELDKIKTLNKVITLQNFQKLIDKYNKK